MLERNRNSQCQSNRTTVSITSLVLPKLLYFVTSIITWSNSNNMKVFTEFINMPLSVQLFIIPLHSTQTMLKVKVKVKSLSCVRLFDPIDCSLPGSSVHGIFQARVLEWVAISFSRGSSRPRDPTHVSCIARGFFTTDPPGKPRYSFP